MIKGLRFGEKLAFVAALALLGFLFLDWFGLSGVEGVYGDGDTGRSTLSIAHLNTSGWHALGWLTLALCVLAIAAGLALPFVVALYESPVLPVLAAILTVVTAGLALVAILVEGIFQPDGGSTVVLSGYWLGLIATFAIARGGFLSMRDEYLPAVPIKDIEVRPAPPAGPAAQAPA
ncbi:MAG: hypothetical protein JWM71_247 [Solirubrobacteraceae bacterium]|nr:hypothetical protein [Solirubrobacteraceae bacterium]